MSGGLVLDTSVVLNILGSGRAPTILRALDGRKVVVGVTSREVLRHPLDPKAVGDHLGPLISAGLMEKYSLPDAALARFVELTGAAPPDDLDDGEAATLAAAELLGLPAALDENKGRRVARQRLPSIQLSSSAAVFSDPLVVAALGDDLSDALFSALVHARMRVLGEHDAWVRTVLGPQRSKQCPSLRRKIS